MFGDLHFSTAASTMLEETRAGISLNNIDPRHSFVRACYKYPNGLLK